MLRFGAVADVPAGFGPSAVTIGKFDGVHAGHRAVIERLEQLAEPRGLTTTVLTFDRNPLSLLNPAECPAPLTSNAQKLDLLESTGLDAVLVVAFDRAFSEIPPEEFVTGILVGALNAGIVLVGADFRFGVRGSGDVALLRELGAQHGFEVVVMDDVSSEGDRRVSSTWIRDLLAEGDVTRAAELLGAIPTIRADVVHGLQRGRTLGYPTANLSPVVEGFVPADGVYAAWLTVDGLRYPAAVSVGNNPTFEGVPEKTVEAHAIDSFGLDLYDKKAEISFVEYIRGMRKFSGADALAEQMGLDELRIRGVLGLQTP
ncbi:MAG: riboflavin biosynthesis protein RibF [Micrococcales bacterium 70-64]|nr:bifunctional riboflavin kinase/FAD synthetase [Leifsonia sp.]ODU65749.1 MAG: riboflavin biosynthesis protein RibF [Leifsonia sp. SCN 70-46]OJX84376.1 MAG: riboflavin biosynthesis protein RibF [Micrococcales bacterium 70-64]